MVITFMEHFSVQKDKGVDEWLYIFFVLGTLNRKRQKRKIKAYNILA